MCCYGFTHRDGPDPAVEQYWRVDVFEDKVEESVAEGTFLLRLRLHAPGRPHAAAAVQTRRLRQNRRRGNRATCVVMVTKNNFMYKIALLNQLQGYIHQS